MGQCSFKQDGNLNHGDRDVTSKLSNISKKDALHLLKFVYKVMCF